MNYEMVSYGDIIVLAGERDLLSFYMNLLNSKCNKYSFNDYLVEEDAIRFIIICSFSFSQHTAADTICFPCAIIFAQINRKLHTPRSRHIYIA